MSKLHQLPKVDLHIHLDGSVRSATIWDLAAEEGEKTFGTVA
jgi:adenosine deaminase